MHPLFLPSVNMGTAALVSVPVFELTAAKAAANIGSFCAEESRLVIFDRTKDKPWEEKIYCKEMEFGGRVFLSGDAVP